MQPHARKLRWVSLLVLVLGLLATMAALPAEPLVERLRARVETFGVFGPLAFGVAYVVGAMAFLPGTALTLAAGALFGVGTGVLVVTVAATVAALASFFLARRLLRARVERALASHPRFRAIDAAIGAEGGRIVALLRLSPIIPFSLANYAYGLTAVRPLPYAVATVGMLPAVVVYVSLGHLGGVAASGRGASAAQWGLFLAGLAATLLVSVWVTRLARARLAPYESAAPRGGTPGATAGPMRPAGAGTWALATLALAAVGLAALAHGRPSLVRDLFGPPRVHGRELHAALPDAPRIDHGDWAAVLARHVDDAGRVDYAGLARDPARLEAYLEQLAALELAPLGRDERLALYLNAYNAFTLRLVLDHLPLDSIRDIPADERWRGRTFDLGGRELTLEQLEHDRCRAEFVEPRVHFALNCASVSCPPLTQRPYTGDGLEEQLEARARAVHADPRWYAFDPAAGVVQLTPLYDWYRGDFADVAGSPLDYAARYDTRLAASLARGTRPRVTWLDYDWRLNGGP